jgi:hypothetical protein
MSIPPILKSRKFWAALVALVIALFGDRAGIDYAQLLAAISALIAYILGTALEDGLRDRV